MREDPDAMPTFHGSPQDVTPAAPPPMPPARISAAELARLLILGGLDVDTRVTSRGVQIHATIMIADKSHGISLQHPIRTITSDPEGDASHIARQVRAQLDHIRQEQLVIPSRA